MKIHQVVQYLCTSLYVCYTLIKKLFCVWAACSTVRWKLNPRCALGGLTGASSAWCWGVRWWQPFGEQFSSCWGWWDVLFRLVGCYISSRSVTVINQKIRQNGLWSKNFMNEPAICSHTLVALQIWYLHKKMPCRVVCILVPISTTTVGKTRKKVESYFCLYFPQCLEECLSFSWNVQ